MYHLQVPLGKLEVEKFQGGGVLRFFREGLLFFSGWGEIFRGELRFFREGLKFFFLGGGREILSGLRNFKRGRESSGGGGSCKIFRGLKN